MPPMMMHVTVLFADVFVAAVWIAAVLAVCVAVCVGMVPALPARFRSCLWMLTFTVAAVLPCAFLFGQQITRTAVPSHMRLNIDWALPVALLWMALSLYRGYGLLRGVMHLRAVTRRAVQTEQCRALSGLLAGQGGEKFVRRVQVRMSGEVDRPSVVGYLRPTILLPAEVLRETSEADLRQILLHEMQHVRRFDDCTNLLQKVAVALFPFSPALLWMERRLCLERELACDDAVLQVTGAPKTYATCLTQMAEKNLHRRAALLAVAAFGRESELSRRVYQILQWPPRPASRFTYRVASALLLCGLCAGTVALQRFGAPVAFADVLPTMAAVETHASSDVFSGVPARLVRTSFIMPERGAGLRTGIHLNRCAVKMGHTGNARLTVKMGYPARARLVGNMEHPARARFAGKMEHPRATRFAALTTGWPVQRVVSAPVEQMIEYTPEPQDAPVLQQISLPYAVIPTGSGWLVVQL